MSPMRRCLPVLLLVAVWIGLAAEAQDAVAEPASAPAPSIGRIKLGNSDADLNGPWKFHTGDNMAWAQPDFDDSNWGTMDLTAPGGAGTNDFIPGWTAMGYPGYSGYAWYRLQVDVEGTDSPLALKMPHDADDAYQVFVNGKLIGEFGAFGKGRVTAYNSQPRGFPLPKNIRGGVITIAIRMWMDSATRFVSLDAGGMHSPPVLGTSEAIASEVQQIGRASCRERV